MSIVSYFPAADNTVVSLDVPSQAGKLTYTGSSQSPYWSGYQSSLMSISGTTSGTNAGTYTATFALRNTKNVQWSDGTTSSKSVSWTISKADGNVILIYENLSVIGTNKYIFYAKEDTDYLISISSEDSNGETISGSTYDVRMDQTPTRTEAFVTNGDLLWIFAAATDDNCSCEITGSNSNYDLQSARLDIIIQ